MQYLQHLLLRLLLLLPLDLQHLVRLHPPARLLHLLLALQLLGHLLLQR